MSSENIKDIQVSCLGNVNGSDILEVIRSGKPRQIYLANKSFSRILKCRGRSLNALPVGGSLDIIYEKYSEYCDSFLSPQYLQTIRSLFTLHKIKDVYGPELKYLFTGIQKDSAFKPALIEYIKGMRTIMYREDDVARDLCINKGPLCRFDGFNGVYSICRIDRSLFDSGIVNFTFVPTCLLNLILSLPKETSIKEIKSLFLGSIKLYLLNPKARFNRKDAVQYYMYNRAIIDTIVKNLKFPCSIFKRFFAFKSIYEYFLKEGLIPVFTPEESIKASSVFSPS
jgi:hypothetical protein